MPLGSNYLGQAYLGQGYAGGSTVASVTAGLISVIDSQVSTVSVTDGAAYSVGVADS